MASGDVVSDIGAVNTTLAFQPAAGVEVLLSAFGVQGDWSFITDGVLSATIAIGANTINTANDGINTKIFLNNSHYLSIGAKAGQSGWYTGIQIK